MLKPVDYNEAQHAVYAKGRQMPPGALERWMARFAEQLPATRPLTVLDLGSGVGRLTPALADHASGVCGHSGGHTTLWSVKADLTARTISYARGAPCETVFEAVEWPN